jgi:glycosyltransferase involved in cell wall biosynthesis
MRISVIIPAYNEEEIIGSVIQSLVDLYPGYEIIVIDDGSTDDTAGIARKSGAVVFSHPYNMGNGAAIKSGIRKATGDIIVFMDGDNQHRPEEISLLVKHLPKFDMVVGARIKSGQTSTLRWFGNTVFNRLASYVTKCPVKDLTSGFRVVKKEIAKAFLYMLPNSYSYPTTLTLAVLRSGYSLKYIPVEMQKRQKGKSNIRIFKDGVRFFMIIIKICTLYSPMRVFLPVSFVLFLLGTFRYAYTFAVSGSFTNMSALLFIAAIIIFMMGLVSEQISQMRYDRGESRKEL